MKVKITPLSTVNNQIEANKNKSRSRRGNKVTANSIRLLNILLGGIILSTQHIKLLWLGNVVVNDNKQKSSPINKSPSFSSPFLTKLTPRNLSCAPR